MGAVGRIAVIYHLSMLGLYFIHERLWNHIKWGKTSGLFIQMTGMSGAGKSTIAHGVAEKLRNRGIKVEVMDGDEYRTGICGDLGFSKEDRNTNIRRLGFISKVLARNNVVSIISAINPYDDIRSELTKLCDNVKTVYVKCDLETLMRRDPKGFYYRALLPNGDPNKIQNFTGISDPYEEPTAPDLILQTNREAMSFSIAKLENYILGSIQ
tara:strand:+ start:1756 stop:2388 length:633 start_codon:yes stop_codon:yes gene_type:complete